jgi:uncharacterized protein
MTTQAEALYHLQQIDLALLDSHKRLQAIAAKLADSKTVQAAKAKTETAQKQLKPLQTQLRDLELLLQSTRSKRDTTEKRLYSGTVKNPKELQDMQHEIEALKRRDAELEDDILTAMVSVDESQTVLTEAETGLAQVTAAWESEHQELLNEKQTLEAEVNRLEQQRVSAAAAVSSENLTLYNTLKPQKANRAVSKLVGDSCSVCGIEQRAVLAQEVRRNQALVKCGNCGRILVAVK